MDRPAYVTIPLGVQSRTGGSNIQLANSSAGMNSESNLEFASIIATPLPFPNPNGHMPFQSQLAPSIGQLSLNRSVADYRRNQLTARLLHICFTRGTGSGFRMHTQGFPPPDHVNDIRFGRAQLLNSIPTRDLSSFLNGQINIQNQIISDLANVHQIPFGGYPGTHPNASSQDLWNQTSSHSQPAHPTSFVVAQYMSNGDAACELVAVSLPIANNPISLRDQPRIDTEQNLAEFSFQLTEASSQCRPAQNMNSMHYGPYQSHAIRTRRHMNRVNSGPYACPRCQNEFAFSQSLASHLREHCMLDDQTNWFTSATCRMMIADAHTYLPPTRSLFPPVSLNNTNRGNGTMNFSDGATNRGSNLSIGFRRESNSIAVQEIPLGRNNDHPTAVALVQSSPAMDLTANDGHVTEPTPSEQASLESKAPNQGQPAADVATKDKVPCVSQSIKEESSG